MTFACSGPNTLNAILAIEALGYLSAAMVLFILIASYKQRDKRQLSSLRGTSLILAFIYHPAWVVSARSGDCGMMKLMATILVSYIAIRIFFSRKSLNP